jgi:hypothetical protein
MQYAAHLPTLPSTRSLAAPLVALVVGAGAATGAYALIDNADEGAQASKVIVVESPAPGSAAIAGKNEAATAAGISGPAGLELRGSKASTSSSSGDADTARRTDPHGVASSLRDR